MARHSPDFHLRLAQDRADIAAAQRLRYDVFVDEMGGRGLGVDHKARREADPFDEKTDHLLLIDRAVPDAPVVGTYRLLRGDMLSAGEGFYSASEYDLSALTGSGRSLLELGRSCLHPDYRGGPALLALWQGLFAYVMKHRIEVLFGVGSFPGTDPGAIAPALSFLHHRHRAPADLMIRAQGEAALSMDLCAEADIDRVAATRSLPALIKSYLKLGGFVGEGAWIDRAFNTIDIGVVVDVARVPADMRARYAGGVTL